MAENIDSKDVSESGRPSWAYPFDDPAEIARREEERQLRVGEMRSAIAFRQKPNPYETDDFWIRQFILVRAVQSQLHQR